MNYYLGVDGGASKTEVVVVDEIGYIAGRGISGPTNLVVTSPEASINNLHIAIARATSSLSLEAKIKGLVLGLAGMDTKQEERTAYEIFSPVISKTVGSDWKIANDSWTGLRSGSDRKNAVVLIAGTGSNCSGKNEHGATATVGAMGFLLSDEGSGYYIGHQMLRAAVQSFDGRGPKTIIEEIVKNEFQVETIRALKRKIYLPLVSKAKVAKMAKLCFEAKESGDQVAEKIISQVIEDLKLMVTTVVKKLDLTDKEFDLVLIGGIINNSYTKKPLIDSLKVIFPKIDIISPEEPPAFGAALMALESYK